MKTPIADVLRAGRGEVHTLSPEASVGTAISRMARHSVGSVVVVAKGAVVGVLSERHIIAGMANGQRALDLVPVRDLMDRAPPLIAPRTTVGEAMSLMTERFTRHLPVVDSGALVGLVSIGDLTRWVTQELRGEVEALHSYIGGSYQ